MDKPVKKYERRTKSPEQALAALMNLCSKAERSSGDALRLMRNWGIEDDAERRKVLKTLTEQRFIDDRRYAAAYVRDKASLSGWGRFKIRAGLKTKGIADDIINDALENIDDKRSREKLEDIIRVKNKTVIAASDYDRRTKLIRFGLSRGFDYDAVLSVVDKYARASED